MSVKKHNPMSDGDNVVLDVDPDLLVDLNPLEDLDLLEEVGLELIEEQAPWVAARCSMAKVPCASVPCVSASVSEPCAVAVHFMCHTCNDAIICNERLEMNNFGTS